MPGWQLRRNSSVRPSRPGRPDRAGVRIVNPSTAFAVTLVDELVRCGLREAVLAPGSRSAPLAIALWEESAAPDGPPAARAHR